MRAAHLLAGALLLAVLITPALAMNDTFGTEEGGGATTTYSRSHSGSFVSGSLSKIYFGSISTMGSLQYIKEWVDAGSFSRGSIPMTKNFSYDNNAYLTVGSTLISRGTYGYVINGQTGELYLYYFSSWWNTNSTSGAVTADIHWNSTDFNLYLFEQGGAAASYAGTTNATFIDDTWSYVLVAQPHDQRRIFPFFHWYNNQTADFGVGENLTVLRTINGINYPSRIIIRSDTVNYIDEQSSAPTVMVNGITEAPYYLEVLAGDGTWYNFTFLEGGAPIGANAFVDVAVWDGSKNALLDGVLVTMTGVTDPTWSGYGYTGALGVTGEIEFSVVTGDAYNFSATATGYTTAYMNHTQTQTEQKINLVMFPDVGYSTLEFYVLNTLTGYPITGVPVNILDHGTGAHKGMLTVSGFARFNTTSGHVYDWDVAKGMGECDTCYVPVAGNTTAESGPKLITVYLTTWGNQTGGGEDDEIDDPHAAAESVMEMIYGMLPALLMVVFLMLFVGAIDRRKR